MSEVNITPLGAFLLGQQLRRNLAAVREPVAYLYNGVRLPKLPEWDKEAYPYAVIYKNNLGKYKLLCSANRIIESIDGTGQATGYFQIPDGDWLRTGYSDGIWGDFAQHSGQELLTLYTLIWTNTDIHYADGTVYLAYSEPVPVYE